MSDRWSLAARVSLYQGLFSSGHYGIVVHPGLGLCLQGPTAPKDQGPIKLFLEHFEMNTGRSKSMSMRYRIWQYERDARDARGTCKHS